MPATSTGPAQVTISSSSLPNGFCPSTEQERLNEYARRLSGSLPGSYSTFLVQNATPNAVDRDKPWLRLNADGTIDRWYTFANGYWRSIHPEFTGKVIMWTGALSAVDSLDGGSTGTATETTGPFWEEVTGMRAKMPIGVGTLESSTAIAVTGTGGSEKHVLTVAELAPHRHELQSFSTGNGYATGSSGPAWNVSGAASVPTSAGVASTGSGSAHNNMPPYYGVYFLKRTVRKYYII